MTRRALFALIPAVAAPLSAFMSAKEAEKEGRQLLGRPARLPVGSEITIEDNRLRLGPFRNWFVVEKSPEWDSAVVISHSTTDGLSKQRISCHRVEQVGIEFRHYGKSIEIPEA